MNCLSRVGILTFLLKSINEHLHHCLCFLLKIPGWASVQVSDSPYLVVTMGLTSGRGLKAASYFFHLITFRSYLPQLTYQCAQKWL